MNAKVCEMIWNAAGKPSMEVQVKGVCRTCGADSVGLLFSDWVKDTFTDWDKLTAGTIICHACQFCFSEKNEKLTKITGKDKPQRMRNYSHFVVGGEWIPLSKGDKRRMSELLLSDPEVTVIAESGQKHIIFRSKPGWWQFEESAFRPFPDKLRVVQAVVEEMYEGFSKAEITTGRYIQHRILEFGLERWSRLDTQVRAIRGTPVLTLALFLAQKEENDDESGDRGEVALADVVRDSRELQGSIRPKHLGAIREQHPKRGLHLQPDTLF